MSFVREFAFAHTPADQHFSRSLSVWMPARLWRDYFLAWPKEMPRRGVLVTSFGEQIPFEGFLTTDALLLLERRTPDTIGARKLILPYSQVVAIKLVDVMKTKVLATAGFVGELPNQG